MSEAIVGIDLGTSNSVVAYFDDDAQVRVLADEWHGSRGPGPDEARHDPRVSR